MIAIKGLHKKFGRLQVLQGIDLEIRDPGIYAVLGPNGSGKTTLIKSILGMVIPNSGSITVSGNPVRGRWAYRDQIDYMPQIAQFPPNLKVNELLRMISDLRSRPAGDHRLVQVFGLQPYLDRKLGHLSGGTRQKVNIVLSLMFDCDLLILDEPTTGLDPVALISLKELIFEARDRGKIILITSHIMSFVEEVADRIVFLLDGNIHYSGGVQELKAEKQQDNLEHAIAALLTEHHV